MHTAERIIDYDELPMGSVWDGHPIRKTLNCDGCKFLVVVQKSSQNMEICDWGIAWKILDSSKKARKCVKIGRTPPQFSSSDSIEKLK